MSNVAISAVLSHMENLKHTLMHQSSEAEKSIERMQRDRGNALVWINDAEIEIADGKASIAWLEAEIDRMGRL